MGEAWDAVKARNDALLFRGWGIGGGKGVWSERKGTLGDIWILDSITALSDMSRVTKAFFESLSNVQGPPSSSTPLDTPPVQPIKSAFAVKLDILLSWATAKTSSRSRLVNAQRSYAVSTILFHFLASRAGTSSQPTGGWTALVEDEIYSWIEDSALAREAEHTEAVADVLGEMARRGVISYATYLMRLMARGMTWSTVGQSWEEVNVSLGPPNLAYSLLTSARRVVCRVRSFRTNFACSVPSLSSRRRSRYAINAMSPSTATCQR